MVVGGGAEGIAREEENENGRGAKKEGGIERRRRKKGRRGSCIIGSTLSGWCLHVHHCIARRTSAGTPDQQGTKIRKAPSPDSVSPSGLRACVEQLAPTFTRIFNRSLELCEVPLCFQNSTSIPVPKTNSITALNNHRTVTLTSVHRF